jgi:hypothetical protein
MKLNTRFIKNNFDKICVLFSGLLFIASFFIVSNGIFLITTNFWSNNLFASPDQTLFTSSTRIEFNLEFKYLLLFILGFIFMLHIANMYINAKKIKSLNRIYNFIKENEAGILYSSLLTLVAILSGLQDLSTLVLVLVVSSIATILIKKSNNTDKFLLKSGQILGILPWILILLLSLGTVVYGSVRSTWFVYILDLFSLVSFGILSVSHKKIFKNIKILINNEYLIIPLINLAFFIVLIIGLHQRV